MGSSSEATKVRLFVPPSFEGVSSVVVLEEIIHKNIALEVIYTNSLDFRDYQQFSNTDIVVVIGLPYRGYNLPADFFLTVDVPFMDFIHICTYGEQIRGENILSLVTVDTDPMKELYTLLKQKDSTILAQNVTLTDKANYLVEAIQAYRAWVWEGNDTTRVLLALYHASYKRLPMLLRGLSLPTAVKQYAPIIKGQLEKMGDYIERKRETVKTRQVLVEGESCVLKVVYAEEYINELANDLLNREVTAMPVIICVGRTTKSSDIFSVRTRGVHAGQVANLINEGNGKDAVATVFAGISYAELMGNAFVSKLNQ